MTQKWNLQDIRPTNPRPPRRPAPGVGERPSPQSDRMRDPIDRPTRPSHPEEPDPEFNNLPPVSISDGKKKRRFSYTLALILCVAIVLTGFGISVATGGATITVFPKNRTVTVNAEFTAYRDKQPEELTYEILTLEATGERQVTATGQEEVVTQATGIIEIIKTTPGAERLIKNTRFATSDGKVFRIQESVVVPGAVNNDAGELQSGRIQAEVFADEAGEEYNLSANTRFTIPGFEESGLTELFNSVSAVNPEAFTGGFDGPRFIIDEDELATSRQALQQELRDSLLTKIADSQPTGFTAFDNSIAITYEALPAVQYGDTLVTIREQAILQIPLFRSTDLASFIAKETIVGYNLSEGVRIANPEEIRFSYLSPTTSQSVIANEDSLSFKIVGNTEIVWTYDAEDIIANLVGKEDTAHTVVLGQYPGIERSTIDIKPFWTRTFPSDEAKITLTEVIE